MKDTFKVGDKVKRKAEKLDTWSWNEECNESDVDPKGVFEVIGIFENEGITLKEMNNEYTFAIYNFELVETSKETQMQEAFALAKSLIGKTIVCNGANTKYTVTGVLFRQDTTDDSGLGWSCNKFLKENGWLVGVQFGTMNYPVQEVSEVPTELNVQLNGSFAATITKGKGKVKINGVTFPIEKIQEIVESHNKL